MSSTTISFSPLLLHNCIQILFIASNYTACCILLLSRTNQDQDHTPTPQPYHVDRSNQNNPTQGPQQPVLAKGLLHPVDFSRIIDEITSKHPAAGDLILWVGDSDWCLHAAFDFGNELPCHCYAKEGSVGPLRRDPVLFLVFALLVYGSLHATLVEPFVPHAVALFCPG